jgi:hypothetical protein
MRNSGKIGRGRNGRDSGTGEKDDWQAAKEKAG